MSAAHLRCKDAVNAVDLFSRKFRLICGSSGQPSAAADPKTES